MQQRMKTGFLVGLALLVGVCAHGELSVAGTAQAVHGVSGLTVVQGELTLPSQGVWRLVDGSLRGDSLRQLELMPPPELHRQEQGTRAAIIARQRELGAGANALRSLWWPCLDYGRKHGGQPPPSLDDIDWELHSWMRQNIGQSPYEAGKDAVGPFCALVKGARFEFAPEANIEHAHPVNKDILAVELKPLYADGKHWVLLTNGQTERVVVDVGLMARMGLEVKPILAVSGDDQELAAEVRYGLYALKTGETPVQFKLLNRETGAAISCVWNPATEAAAGPEAIEQWATLRGRRWAAMARDMDAPILKSWLWVQSNLYGTRIDMSPPRGRGRGRRRQGENTTDMFGVLGGRAAMRETLQLQALEVDDAAAPEAPGVAVAEIPGVEVKSHPFAEMLGDQPGGRLALADLVPPDRFFVYAARPAALLPLLDDGADFLARAGTAAAGRSLGYDLETRYLGKLGMTREWLDQVLASGAVAEMALFMPDLFLIDGTDMTAVCRVPQMAVMKRLLSLVGVGDLGGGKPVAVANARGGKTYWAAAGDLLIVGTSEREVAASLALAAGAGGGLGSTAEFRYMLTQLPPVAGTRLYVYFSDSFIRRLVGPEVKLGQLRRLKDKARLEAASAAALLYVADGQKGTPGVPRLVEAGYLPGGGAFDGISLEDGSLVAMSSRYGRLDNLAPISAHPVATASVAEAEAYKRYVESYSRYWRRYFDPIAVRLDDTGDGALEISTFILPLLDNSIYNGLEEVLVEDHRTPPLRVPQISPKPVAMFSMKLSEKMWMEFLDDFLRHARGMDATGWKALDDLGPGFHFAIHDSNPIIAFGSGEMLGLGGGLAEMDDDMLGIPLFLSMLTRPCTMLVELRQDQAVRELLSGGGLARLLPFGEDMMRTSYYKLAGQDAWIYGIEFFGINLRFRFEVQDNYLLISNLPWGPKVEVGAVDVAAASCLELSLNPLAATEQFAAMHTAAAEKDRRLAMEGIGYLYPLMLAGESAESALGRHRQLLGFAPVHPGEGGWAVIDGRLKSTLYGAPGSEQQPAYAVGNSRFGVLQGVSNLRMNLQFEDTGLRTRVRWIYHRE